MTEHKFTDEEIVKALNCCKTPKCSNCAECPKRHLGTDCLGELICDTLDLINRQKAEIENLTILLNGGKTKTIGKFIPRGYEQITIDFEEDEK